MRRLFPGNVGGTEADVINNIIKLIKFILS